MMSQRPTVHIVDDDASVTKSLARLLRSAGLDSVAYSSAEAFLGASRPAGPGCLLLDLQLPGTTGLELQATLRAARIDLPIVFLSGHGDIPASVRAMKGGAVDFLTKPVDDEELLAAVRRALERDAAARKAGAHLQAIREHLAGLTDREREVMRCIISGALNKQIAAHLGIAEKTVKVHRARVLEKMGGVPLAELVRLCAEAGIEPLHVG